MSTSVACIVLPSSMYADQGEKVSLARSYSYPLCVLFVHLRVPKAKLDRGNWMAGATSDVSARDEPRTAGELETYDILILDALGKQSLTSARSLGRAGLRVALGESIGQYQQAPVAAILALPLLCARCSVARL